MAEAGGLLSLSGTVRNFAGSELVWTLPISALVLDLKAEIKRHWNIPTTEQKLVFSGSILANSEQLGARTASGGCALDVFLVRGPAFHFDKGLAHAHIRMGADSSVVTHGGQKEYQAAFLSDVLHVEGCYTVRFRLKDAGGNSFREMYVGVAPDENRDWSYLKGAYLNRKGLYVDGFAGTGWRHTRWQCCELFEEPRRQKLKQEEDKKREFPSEALPVLDFSKEGMVFQGKDFDELKDACVQATKTEDAYLKEIRAMPETCEFIMEVDMPMSQLRFLTVDRKQLEHLDLPELLTTPTRLCATLAFPRQSVVIVDK